MHILGMVLGYFLGSAIFGWWGALLGTLIALGITAQIALSESKSRFSLLQKKMEFQQRKIAELEQIVSSLTPSLPEETTPNAIIYKLGAANEADMINEAETPLDASQAPQKPKEALADNQQAIVLEKETNEAVISELPEKAHEQALKQEVEQPSAKIKKVNIPVAEPVFVYPIGQKTNKPLERNDSLADNVKDKNEAQSWTYESKAKPKSESTEAEDYAHQEDYASQGENQNRADDLPIMKFLDKVSRWFLRGNPILKVGAIILFLGLAFLLRYVAAHTYFPIELRYAAVAFAAFALTAIGWKVRKKNPASALMLQGLGVGVFYLTIFAAMKLHPLIDPYMGFAILVVVAAAAIVLALLQNSLSLMLAATIGGFAAPILASTGGGSHIALFSYFAILDIAILIISWFKAWRSLNLVGFFGTLSIGGAWAMRSYELSFYLSTQLFLILFFVLFLGIALLFAKRQLIESLDGKNGDITSLIKAAQKTYYVDGTLLFGVPIVGFGLQYALVRNFEFGPAYSAFILGAFYIMLAFAVLKRGQNALQLLFESCLVLGLIFASLAVPLAFDAEWTTSIWAVEASAIYWLSLRQNHLTSRYFSLAVLTGAVISWFATLDANGTDTVLNASKLGTVLIVCSLVFTWWNASRADKSRWKEWESNIPEILAGASVVAIGLSPSVFFAYYGATIVTAILSTIMVIIGLKLHNWVVKLFATIFFFYSGVVYLQGISVQNAYAEFKPDFLPIFILSLSLLIAGFMAQYQIKEDDANNDGTQKEDLTDRIFEGVFVGLMVLSWAFMILATIDYNAVGLIKVHGVLAVSVASFVVWALLAQKFQWRILANICLCFAPYALIIFVCAFTQDFSAVPSVDDISQFAVAALYKPWANWGWLLWPASLLLHGAMLFKLLPLGQKDIARVVHIAGAWLAVCLVSATCSALLIDVAGSFNAWRWLGWLVGPVGYLILVTAKGQKWPLASDPMAYHVIAATPIAALTFGWIWFANIINDGSAVPLPYIPLVNPLDLGLLISLFALFMWSDREPFIKEFLSRQAILLIFGVTGFAIITAIILRCVHHFAGIDWQTATLWSSTIAQTTLAIAWTVIALSAMLIGNRKGLRVLWICGTTLIGVVVLKLFTVDLGGSGTMERIISFTGVGLLLLIIGYFAPMPPKEMQNQFNQKKDGGEQEL